jgi:histidine triad (HIT) family protein
VSCEFCRIVAGTAPASKVFEDDTAVAFLDIAPMNPGHLLVVPRTHADGLADLEPRTGEHLWRIGQRLAAALRRSDVRCEGVNFFLADGAAAFQEVMHVHLHVLPRWKGDGVKLVYKAGRPGRKDLDAVAADLREAARNLALPGERA